MDRIAPIAPYWHPPLDPAKWAAQSTAAPVLHACTTLRAPLLATSSGPGAKFAIDAALFTLLRGYTVLLTAAPSILDPTTAAFLPLADGSPGPAHNAQPFKDPIPLKSAHVLRYQPSPDQPYGRSILAAVSDHLTLRAKVETAWLAAATAFGKPLLTAAIPPGATQELVNQVYARLKELRDTGIAAFPEDIPVTVHNPSYGTPVNHAELLHYLDAAIRRTLTNRDVSPSILGGRALETGTSVASRDAAITARIEELRHLAIEAAAACNLDANFPPQYLPSNLAA